MGDIPPWGTPSDEPSRDASQPKAARPAGLLDVGRLIVKERGGFLSSATYDLLTVDGEPLGSVAKEAGSGGLFGSTVKGTWVVADARGRTFATVTRPSSWGKGRYVITGPDGREAGTLTQENSFTAPRMSIAATDGTSARLTGGGFGSGGERVLTRSDGMEVGRVSPAPVGLGSFLAGNDAYLVRLRPELTGPGRLCAVVSILCVDLILNEKARQANSNSSTGTTFGNGF